MNHLEECINETAEAVKPETYGLEQAGWDSKKLHKLQKKAKQATDMVDAEINELQGELEKLMLRRKEISSPLEAEMERLKGNLIAFHRDQLAAGGDKTIKLPWATLTSKKQPQGYDRDEMALLKWAQCNANEFIKTAEPAIDWAELKKGLVVVAGKVLLKETGEVVEGIMAKDIDVKFNVEVL